MTATFKVGDRVRIRTGHRIYQVIEIEPPEHHALLPATQIVRIKPEDDKGVEQLYGNAVLMKVECPRRLAD
jgi:hypothetical protein